MIKLPRWLICGLVLPLIFLNGWLLILILHYFQSLITIFVASTLLSFLLNYPVRWLVTQRVRRTNAVLWVVSLALLLIVVLGITLVPIAIEQLNELGNRLPSWIESSDRQLTALNEWAKTRNFPIDFSSSISQIIDRFTSILQSLAGQLLSVILGTVDRVFSTILTVVMTFYMLLHGEQLWEGIYQWLPEPIGPKIRSLLRQNFHNYYVGQASLAAIVAVFMTFSLWLLKVPFSLLFGLIVGIMALFPFGVGLSICLVSFLMMLQSFWLGVRVLTVTAVLQQVIENGIAPRLLGGFTGLNPVWILVSLLVGIKVAGVLGLLIAVPMAGFLKSLINFWRTLEFKNSPEVKSEVQDLAEEQSSSTI
jgi:predicted PurR-regulated permease PerM